MKKFFCLVLFFVLVSSLAFPAQDTIKLRTLGRAPLTSPVIDATTAKQVVKNHAEAIRNLEGKELFSNLIEQLDRADFRKGTVRVGSTMRWMLFRDRNNNVSHLSDLEWAGQEPIQGFGFEIIHNEMIYNFFVPQVCGNICLLNIEKQPEKPIMVPPVKPQEPAKPEKPAEESKEQEKPIEQEKPKPISQPVVDEQSLPAPKKHRPNIKIYAGPWVPWEPMTFSFTNQDINVSHDFRKYLPDYEQYIIDKNSTTGTMIMKENNFPYRSGDTAFLKQSRSITTRWSGINFIAGIEFRMFRSNFWLDLAYYQSRTFHASAQEYYEDMLFKEVKYLGYYAPITQEQQVSCPPKYHRYSIDLNRRANERQIDYNITARGIRFLLRYYLNIGNRFSLSPAFGIIDQQFVIKTNDTSVSRVLCPFKDEVISESERWESRKKEDNYELALTGNIVAELKLLKFLSVAVEGSYQKFPEQQLNHESLVYPNLETSFKSKTWRATATIKILF